MNKPVLLFVISLLWSHVASQYCITPQKTMSECISIYKCPQLFAAAKRNPMPGHIMSYLRRSHCGPVGSPTVCCSDVPAHNTDLQIEPVNSEDSSLEPRNTCGIDTNGDRIFGGNVTNLGEFPWMALLGYRTSYNTLTYECGGSLLNHRYVLTAAHCIIGQIEIDIGQLVTVRLGEHDTRTDIDCINQVCAEPHQEIPVAETFPHPGFTDTMRNRPDDIGLVRLARRVKYNAYVRPICLVNANERLAVGIDVIAAGWGKTLNNKPSPLKLKVQLPMYDHDDCVTVYRAFRAELTNKQLCAGGVADKDACTGDSGGPVMRQKPDGLWEAVGLVSFGYECGINGIPAVYTSTASYLDWIQNVMRMSNI